MPNGTAWDILKDMLKHADPDSNISIPAYLLELFVIEVAKDVRDKALRDIGSLI